MITYWAPNASPNGSGRGPVGLFDFMASPFRPPQHLEVVEVGYGLDGGSVTVDAKGCSLEHTGYIYLGVTSEEDPRKVEGAKQIIDLGSKPDLRSLRQLTVAYFG